MAKDFSKYINNIPIIPGVATKVMNIAEERIHISFKELENIIKVDPGLTAKILKVANSALYARQQDISSLQIAITLLGFKNIKSLVLLVTTSSIFQKDKQTAFYKRFWKHSIITAFLGKKMALQQNKKEISETVFLGGLLHNIGQALLFNVDKNAYEEIFESEKEGKELIESFEEKIFGVNHRQIGAEIFKKWTFPDVFTDIVQEHNSIYITSPHKTIIQYVTVASLLTDRFGFGNYSLLKDDLLVKLLPHISMTEDDIQFFAEHHLDMLKNDPLFLECKSLFGFQ